MKTLLVLLFSLGLCSFSHAVTNLIANGDFETGTLTPWTGSGATVQTVGTNHVCALSGHGVVNAIGQDITTTVGAQYYVAADVSVSSGGSVLGISAANSTVALRFVPNSSVLSVTPRVGFVFTATTATTQVYVNIEEGDLTLDNVVVYELKRSTLGGRYSGRATLTTSLPSPDPTKSVYSSPTSARVTPDGLITILNPGSATQGVIFSDGTIELPSSPVTSPVRGKASIKGGRITVTFPAPSFPASAITGADASNRASGIIPITETQTLVLTRVGP